MDGMEEHFQKKQDQIPMQKQLTGLKTPITTSLNLPHIYKNYDSKAVLTALRTIVYKVVQCGNQHALKYAGQVSLLQLMQTVIVTLLFQTTDHLCWEHK